MKAHISQDTRNTARSSRVDHKEAKVTGAVVFCIGCGEKA